MISYLINRPIAVFVGFLSLSVLGIFSMYQIPTSLLPNIDIPTIVIKTQIPNSSNKQIEDKITSVLRTNLKGLDDLEAMETLSSDFSSELVLKFKYGTRMDFKILEVNEKIDLLINLLPRNLDRPRVIKINTSDVPITRLNLVAKKTSLFELSELTQKVIKKRLEQIKGVSLVDINGLEDVQIAIIPNQGVLRALGLNENVITTNLQTANADYGSLTVKDGEYRYFLKFANYLTNVEDIKAIEVRLPSGNVVKLSDLAMVKIVSTERYGSHIFNGKEGLVVTIHKQADANMKDVVENLKKSIQYFREDYRDVEFNLTQDQSFLLDESIQNLLQDLAYGSFFCILLLFLLISNYASPIMMAVSIPMSLCLTFIFFYVLDVSFNIISLSGLALGIGMLIDNSIIVVENINRKISENFSIDQSCVTGVREVISPIVSNVLTTVAIYGPLIFLSGMAGILVYDQAIALTISLAVSLSVAFVFTPVLYRYLYINYSFSIQSDTEVFKFILRGYHNMMVNIFKFRVQYLVITILIMPIGIIFLLSMPLKNLPSLTETESFVKIDWKVPITEQENRSRILLLSPILRKNVEMWEADVGLGQFVYFQDGGGVEKASLYYKCKSENEKIKVDSLIKKMLVSNYPQARIEFHPAPNAFTQLFDEHTPYLEARFRPLENKEQSLPQLEARLSKLQIPFSKGGGFDIQSDIRIEIDEKKLLLFNVQRSALEASLSRTFNTIPITSFENFKNRNTVSYMSNDESFDDKLLYPVTNAAGLTFPIRTFISTSKNVSKKYCTGDKVGEYSSIIFDKSNVKDISSLSEEIDGISAEIGYDYELSGSYYSNNKLMLEMLAIFMVSMILIYSILAIQFESLVEPLIVMLTLPLGVVGAMLLLWLSGGNINIMTCIGLIIVLGIIVDDPSLKIETMNRLRKIYNDEGMNPNDALLHAIRAAGDVCLKPLLLVSLTTSLAMLPVLFMGGIGNELQKPMALVIIGGLTVGTFFTLWFIPLAYWYVKKK